MSKLTHYLRTYRKRSGLTQRDVAFLLGVSSGSTVSQLEWQRREANLKIAFAYAAIFGVSIHDLLPGIEMEILNAVSQRAALLVKQLNARNDRSKHQHRIEHLQALRLEPVSAGKRRNVNKNKKNSTCLGN